MAGRNLLADEAPAGRNLLANEAPRVPSQFEETKEFFKGAALPALGIAQSIPYEPIQRFATEKVQQIEATPEYVRPGATTGARGLGKFVGSMGLTTLPIPTVLQRTAQLSTPARVGARVVGGAATGAGTSALIQEAPTMEEIGPRKKEAAVVGGALGGVLGTVPSLAEAAKAGYSRLSKTLNRAFGGDAKRLAEELRNYASGRAGEEAKIAKRLADDAEKQAGVSTKRATIAEQEAARQAQIGEQRLGAMPGTRGEVEAGAMRAIPASEQSVGQRIKDAANTVFQRLRTERSNRVEVNKQAAFQDAFQKETQGQRVDETEAFKNLIQEIDATITNPVTGLSNVEVSALRQQLQSIKNQLDPIKMVGDTAIGQPVSFQGLETLRRFLNDRAFGLPAEGFDAIGQQEAGNLAKGVEKIMVEFSPKVRTYIDQYRKDSEPLRVFATKIGKALTGEQLKGGGANYATVAAQNIPGRIFKDRESYQALVDALGGDKRFASSEAAKYFTSEIEKLGGDPKKIQSFIRDNREMLSVTGNKDLFERYFAQLQQATKRGEFAAGKAKTEAETAKTQLGLAEQQRALAQDFETLQSNIVTAKDAAEIARATDAFAKKALSSGRINQQQYRQIMERSNSILSTVADQRIAKEEINRAIPRILGFGALGAAGVYGVRSLEK
jgi:hypothetical protein